MSSVSMRKPGARMSALTRGKLLHSYLRAETGETVEFRLHTDRRHFRMEVRIGPEIIYELGLFRTTGIALAWATGWQACDNHREER